MSILKEYGIFCDTGYTLLKKVSSHDFQNLCTRFVTYVQQDGSFLYTSRTFASGFCVLFLQLFFIQILYLVFLAGNLSLSLPVDGKQLSFQRYHLSFLTRLKYSYVLQMNFSGCFFLFSFDGFTIPVYSWSVKHVF